MNRIINDDGTFSANGGLDLYYQRWIAPDAAVRGAVMIVHGIGEHSSAYGNVVDRLAPAGFPIYGFDLRGHGRSPGKHGFIRNWEDYREDVHAFEHIVAEQQTGRPLFLLGHSLGGVIVLDYALRYPESLAGVIAIGPAIGEIGLSPALMALARIVSRVWPSFSLSTGLDVTAISRDPQVLNDYRNDPLVHDRGTARLGAETERTVDWIQQHAADLHVPLLIQHGEDDRIARSTGSRRFMSNVTMGDKTLIEYPRAFHQVHNDVGHEQVTADLLDWLGQHVDEEKGLEPMASEHTGSPA